MQRRTTGPDGAENKPAESVPSRPCPVKDPKEAVTTRIPVPIWLRGGVLSSAQWVGIAFLGALYYGTAKLGISLEVAQGVVTPVWAPTGISLAALLLFGYRLWPGVAIGAVAANAASDVSLATALLIATGNVLEALSGAYLLRRVARFDTALQRVRDVLAFVTLGAFVSTTVSATIGTTSLWLTGEIGSYAFSSKWVLWWFGDAVGDLLVAPLLLVWAWRPCNKADVRTTLEAVVLLAALITVSLITFRGGPPNYPFAVFPLLVWGTLRFRQRGATATVFVVSVLAIWATLTRSVPFEGATLAQSLGTLQALIGVVAVTNLLLAATITERERAEKALREESGTVQLLKEIAIASNEAPTIEDALQAVVDRVCAFTSWPVGHAYARDATGNLTSTGIWHLEVPRRFEALRRVSEGRRFAPDIGLPGRVLSTGKPAWIADVTKDPNFSRASQVSDLGIKAGFAFPVLIGDEVAAVLEFFSDDVAVLDEVLLGVMASVGTQVGRVVERQGAENALKASEQRSRAIIDTARDAYIAMDTTDTITDWNIEAERTFGWAREEALGRKVADAIFPTQHRASYRRALDHFLSKGEGPIADKRLELTALHRDGHEFPVELALWSIRTGDGHRLNAFVQDISQRKRAEWRRLSESEERFRKIFEESPVGMSTVNADFHFLRTNDAFCRMVGYSQEELSSLTVADVTRPEDGNSDVMVAKKLFAGEHLSYQVEKRLLTKRGDDIWVNSTSSLFRDPKGNLPCVLEIVEDITERRRAEQQLFHQAMHDSLTGLPNRTLFMDRLTLALDRLRRHQSAVAVMFVDLDRFKVINDSLGHEVGDEVLIAVAHRVEAVLRPSDTVARFGGDEFVILCEEAADERAAAEIADRVATTVREPIPLQSGEVVLTASVGIALSRTPAGTPENLLRNADAAMYRAKEGGKARCEFFDQALRHRAIKRLETERGLRQAMELDQLRLFYQPQIRLDNGGVFGAEGLVRWQHPKRGLLEPEDFISVAEESGLILELGNWVFKQACSQSSQWSASASARASITVAVNVSTKEFDRPDYVSVVERELGETGMDPRSLCLEITESILMEPIRSTLATLQALREMGLTIAIDDFGTGYSSLSYLKDFPADVLKIDRTFIQGLGTDSEDSAIVAAVIDLAHSSGLVTVAEGVETEIQLKRLRALGCDLAQGFYLAPPRPAQAVTDMLPA